MGHEQPAHRVTLTRPFLMGVTEVTQEMWVAVTGANPANHPAGPRYPVEGVSWCDALPFANVLSTRENLAPAYVLPDEIRIGADAAACEKAAGQPTLNLDAPGYRLPLEAEWEAAARADTSTRYAGGDDPSTVAWFDRTSGWQTHPVGMLQPNAWGLFDMSGNVLEWTWDGYVPYTSDAVTDPTGDATSAFRARRGGSWETVEQGIRVTDRAGRDAQARTKLLGFRLARTGG